MVTEVQRGALTRAVFDWERSTFASESLAAFASRNPRKIDFSSFTQGQSKGRTDSTIITGNRSSSKPLKGNLAADGNIVIPVEPRNVGYFLRAGLGKPLRLEVPADDIKTGTGVWTIAIPVSDSVATFDPLTLDDDAAVSAGDRVIYEDPDTSGVYYSAYLIVDNTGTWDVAIERDGTTNTAVIAAAPIIAIINNEAETSPGTITISSGVATFSVTHTFLDAATTPTGAMIRYDLANTEKRVYIASKLTATTYTVETGDGRTPADHGALDVDSIETKPTYRQRFEVHATRRLESFLLEKTFNDPSVQVPPESALFLGCKIGSLDLSVQGNVENELLLTVAILAKKRLERWIAYDLEDQNQGGTISISTSTATMSVSQSSATIGDYCIFREGTLATDPVIGVIMSAGATTSWTVTDFQGNVPADTGSPRTIIAIYTPGGTAVGSVLDRFEQGDFAAEVAGVSTDVLEQFDLSISDNEEGDVRTIGTAGYRRNIPEGQVMATGTIRALFDNKTIITRAENDTETSLKLTGTIPVDEAETYNYIFEVYIEQALLDEPVRPIDGPAGVRAEMGFTGYEDSGSSTGTIVRIDLTTDQEYFHEDDAFPATSPAVS